MLEFREKADDILNAYKQRLSKVRGVELVDAYNGVRDILDDYWNIEDDLTEELCNQIDEEREIVWTELREDNEERLREYTDEIYEELKDRLEKGELKSP